MTGLLGVLLALVPSLTVTAEPSLPAAAVALAIAALCTASRAVRVTTVPSGGHLARPAYSAGPRLRGHVTDPVHHPLRPRAPGRV